MFREQIIQIFIRKTYFHYADTPTYTIANEGNWKVLKNKQRGNILDPRSRLLPKQYSKINNSAYS